MVISGNVKTPQQLRPQPLIPENQEVGQEVSVGGGQTADIAPDAQVETPAPRSKSCQQIFTIKSITIKRSMMKIKVDKQQHRYQTRKDIGMDNTFNIE